MPPHHVKAPCRCWSGSLLQEWLMGSEKCLSRWPSPASSSSHWLVNSGGEGHTNIDGTAGTPAQHRPPKRQSSDENGAQSDGLSMDRQSAPQIICKHHIVWSRYTRVYHPQLRSALGPIFILSHTWTRLKISWSSTDNWAQTSDEGIKEYLFIFLSIETGIDRVRACGCQAMWGHLASEPECLRKVSSGNAQSWCTISSLKQNSARKSFGVVKTREIFCMNWLTLTAFSSIWMSRGISPSWRR